MRIIYDCLVELDLPDGHALHTRQLCERIAAAGNDVVTVGPRSAYRAPTPRLEPVGLPFLGYSPWRLRIYRWLLRRRLRRLVAEFSPDIIVHKLSQSLEVVVDVARETGVPLAIELNGTLEEGVDSWDERMIRDGLRATAGLDSCLLLGVSPELGARYQEIVGAARQEFRTFENGVDRELFSPAESSRTRAELEIPSDAFVIGYLGSANPKYDFDTLFAGAALARERGIDVHFLVLAPPPVHQRLAVLGKHFLFENRIIALDPVPISEVPAYLPLLDAGMVLLRPEDDHMAPTALKLKEMLLAGVPCLVNVPESWSEWPLAPHVGGIPSGSAEAVCDRIVEIVEEPEAVAARTAAAAEIIRARYDWAGTARVYVGALGRYVERRRRSGEGSAGRSPADRGLVSSTASELPR